MFLGGQALNWSAIRQESVELLREILNFIRLEMDRLALRRQSLLPKQVTGPSQNGNVQQSALRAELLEPPHMEIIKRRHELDAFDEFQDGFVDYQPPLPNAVGPKRSLLEVCN